MARRLAPAALIAAALAACAGEPWPDPPPVDPDEYEAAYEEWRNDRQQTAEYAMRIVGIWPLEEGETPFGSDPSLPIVLPSTASPPRAGIFRRAGDVVTLLPGAGAPLMVDGSLVIQPIEIQGPVELGSISLEVIGLGDLSPGRLFLSAWDAYHPDAQNLPPVDTYPIDSRWRVAARFEAFERPKPVRVPDVRGGYMHFAATGELVFRLDGRELRLTALGEEGGGDLFVMFKDLTNASTTYGGYRILSPAAVADGEWTVLDFNLAANPPCAYSRYTTCPLPPPENGLPVAVEAGEKRYAAGRGFDVSALN